MTKKIILGALLIGLIAVLVWGGINRTLAKSESRVESGTQAETLSGLGRGSDFTEAGTLTGDGMAVELAASPRNGTGQAQGGQGAGAGQGQGGQGGGAGQGQGVEQAVTPLNTAAGQGDQGNGTGLGQGGQGNGAGQGNLAGSQAGLAESGGDPQAEVAEWVTLQGVVESVSTDAAVVVASTGEAITLEGRAWSFAQEAGFSLQAGENVTLTGFYEGDDLEIGYVEALTSGQSIQLRDQNGRPAWAGNGRWNQ